MLLRTPPRSPSRGNEKTNDIPWRMTLRSRHPIEDGENVEEPMLTVTTQATVRTSPPSTRHMTNAITSRMAVVMKLAEKSQTTV